MASFLGLDFSKNYSFYTVPVAFGLAIGPHIYAILLSGKLYKNRSPRTHIEGVNQSQTLDKAKKDRITHLQYASENGFETLGFFASAIAAGTQARLDPVLLNSLSFGYLAVRTAYIVSYVELSGSEWQSVVRTLTWQAGMGFICTLWIKAGMSMAKNYVF